MEDIKVISEIFDRDIFDKINSVDHIKKTEQELEDMKLKIEDKKRLQKERNVLTAQLSRDRKKIEVELLHNKCYELTQAINKVRNIVHKNVLPPELQAQLNFIFDQGDDIYLAANSGSSEESKQTENKKGEGKINFSEYANKPGLVTRVIKQQKTSQGKQNAN